MSGPFASQAEAQIRASIGIALNLLNTGQPGTAELHLARVLAMRPLEPDALQLLGLVRALQGRAAEAEQLYRRSLSVRPNQPHVHLNLANVLLTLGRPEEAIAAYREAVKQKPDYADAHINLAGALSAAGDVEGAERHYRLALRHQPASYRALLGLSALLNEQNRPEESEALLTKALARPPANPRERAELEHNLGVALRLQRRYAEALERYDRVKSLAPDVPVDYNRGNTLSHLGRVDEAIASYRKAIADNPLHLGAHYDLNSLLYRARRDGELLKSYDDAARRAPKAAVLHLQKASFLLRCERFAEARDALEQALAIEPQNPSTRVGLGVALTGLKEFDKAARAYDDARALAPNDPVLHANYAGMLLQAGDPLRAREMAERAVALAPLDQGALAALDLAYRATGDARAEALTDYENFVLTFDLEPPDGFSDMETFNEALNLYLDRLHTDSREHFDQTLKGGTQSFEKIFFAGHDLVDRLRLRIEGAIADYIARMREMEKHPLLGRRTKSFAFSGSWSSRLHDCGFHTNHIHPKGWISSCYYVALPDAVADTDGKQGWLKLGEPSYDAKLKDPIRRVVRPAPGRLVLFPSYMWHGTVPFHSQQSRTTIAFDVVPKP